MESGILNLESRICKLQVFGEAKDFLYGNELIGRYELKH